MSEKKNQNEPLAAEADELEDFGQDIDQMIADIRKELHDGEPDYPESTPETAPALEEFRDQEYLDTFGDSLPEVFLDQPAGQENAEGEESDELSAEYDEDYDEDFDEESDELDDTDALPAQPSRRRGGKHRSRKRRGSAVFSTFSTLIYIVMVAAVSLLLAKFVWMCADDALALTKEDRDVTVTIPENATLDDIADILHEADLINYPWLFKLYGSQANAEERVKAGSYELNGLYDYHALLNGLSSSQSLEIVEVTVIEGYSCKQIFQQLEEAGVCTVEELEDAAANETFDFWFVEDIPQGESNRLEGYLFPDTYEFYKNADPVNVLSKFLENFENRMDDTIMQQVENSGYSLRQIITIASMIEEEAASEEERGDIASVIYNRLNSTELPYLQLDSTVYYAADLMGVEFDTELDNPYNTYRYEGLPAGPIDNPGLSSIKAALNPTTTNYYYFAYGTDGVSHFYEDFDSFSAFLNSDEYAG